MENQTSWLTIKEAMAYLKCSKPTLYRYMKTHKITTAKLGKTLVSKQSIDAVLQQLATAQPMHGVSVGALHNNTEDKF